MNAKTKFLVRSAAVMIVVVGLVALIVLLKQHITKPSGSVVEIQYSQGQRRTETEGSSMIPNTGPLTYPNKRPVYQPSRVPTTFQHVGILVSKTDPSNPIILPLFGRPSPTRKERWEYYAATDKNTMLRIPILYENRNCSDDDVGCTEIYEGEPVVVPTYENLMFTAQMYKLGTALRP